MTPYFQQDWHLFAPEPVTEDSGFLIRAKRSLPDGAVATTRWVDVTTPHIDKLHRQRFWPSRVERLAPAVRQRLEGWRDPQLDELRREKPPVKGTENAAAKAELVPPLAPSELEGRDSALLYVRALASTEATALWGEGFRSVQVRIVINKYPRFSEREVRANRGKVSYYDLAWMKPLRVAR
ncbi:DUF5819 family protein [Streptomyces hypolithicus]